MQTCVQILNFIYFKSFFTSLVHYMFRPTWSSSGAFKIDVENCCTSVSGYNSKVYPRLCAHVLLYMLHDFSYVSCAAALQIYNNRCAHKRGYTLELYSLTEVQQFSTSILKAPDDDHISRNIILIF
jgi:hypothetical protein